MTMARQLRSRRKRACSRAAKSAPTSSPNSKAVPRPPWMPVGASVQGGGGGHEHGLGTGGATRAGHVLLMNVRDAPDTLLQRAKTDAVSAPSTYSRHSFRWGGHSVFGFCNNSHSWEDARHQQTTCQPGGPSSVIRCGPTSGGGVPGKYMVCVKIRGHQPGRLRSSAVGGGSTARPGRSKTYYDAECPARRVRTTRARSRTFFVHQIQRAAQLKRGRSTSHDRGAPCLQLAARTPRARRSGLRMRLRCLSSPRAAAFQRRRGCTSLSSIRRGPDRVAEASSKPPI